MPELPPLRRPPAHDDAHPDRHPHQHARRRGQEPGRQLHLQVQARDQLAEAEVRHSALGGEVTVHDPDLLAGCLGREQWF